MRQIIRSGFLLTTAPRMHIILCVLKSFNFFFNFLCICLYTIKEYLHTVSFISALISYILLAKKIIHQSEKKKRIKKLKEKQNFLKVNKKNVEKNLNQLFAPLLSLCRKLIFFLVSVQRIRHTENIEVSQYLLVGCAPLLGWATVLIPSADPFIATAQHLCRVTQKTDTFDKVTVSSRNQEPKGLLLGQRSKSKILKDKAPKVRTPFTKVKSLDLMQEGEKKELEVTAVPKVRLFLCALIGALHLEGKRIMSEYI